MNNRLILVIILAIIALILVMNSFFTVDETEQVIVLQMGEFKRTVDEPGLHLKMPFIQSVKSLDKRVLTSAVEKEKYITFNQDEEKDEGDSDVGIRLIVDHITRWRISDPKEFYVSFNGSEETAQKNLKGHIDDKLKTELASTYWVDIVSSQREVIIESVTDYVAEKVADLGIEIIDVRIKRADLPDEVEEGVFERVIADRKIEANDARAEGERQALQIRADADREVTVLLAEGYKDSEILRGEGDAIAAAIYAAAYTQAPEFYSLSRALQTYDQIFDNQTTLVLSTESDIFKYLSGSGISSE